MPRRESSGRPGHREGVLTAASLMVTGDAVDEAVELARAMPTLAVGLHVVLADGRRGVAAGPDRAAGRRRGAILPQPDPRRGSLDRQPRGTAGVGPRD